MSSRAPDERLAEDGELSSLQDLSRRVIFTRHARNDQERHAVSRAKLCRAALGTITVLRRFTRQISRELGNVEQRLDRSSEDSREMAPSDGRGPFGDSSIIRLSCLS